MNNEEQLNVEIHVKDLVQQNKEIVEHISAFLNDEGYGHVAVCSALSWLLAKEAVGNGIEIEVAVYNFIKSYKAAEKDNSLIEKYKGVTLDSLGFPERALNCLKAEGLFYLHDLIKCSQRDLLKFPNLGNKTLEDIKAVLAKQNLIIRK